MMYRPQVSGEMDSLPLVEMAQMIAGGLRTATFALVNGPEQGLMVIEHGRIVHAVLARADRVTVEEGEAAAQELLTWDTGQFHVDFDHGCERRTMSANFERIALTAMVRLDERYRINEEDEYLDKIERLVGKLRPSDSEVFRPCQVCAQPCRLAQFMEREAMAAAG